MDLYVQASCVPLPSSNVWPEVTRRSANYHPSIWGDYFLAYTSDLPQIDPRVEEEHEQLKKDLTKMLLATPNTSLQKLNLIDAMQRLGISYHFESHIELSLQCIYDYYEKCIKEDDDLCIVALRFRLLRQQGHPVSSDVFNKFKDQKGKFSESLINSTVAGILSLYEAAHFKVHGEDILEEALTFTTTHLESMLPNLKHSLAAQVNQALELPIQKSLTRLTAKVYISIYEEDDLHDELLLKFAKSDFNILQKMHQQELSHITRWWKSLDVPTKLPFVRDRVVELYFWILGVYFEPQFRQARRILTKIIGMASIIDDVYDVYGTFDELELFTDAIERWNAKAIDQLPSYMQHCYRAVLDVYNEAEEELAKEGKSYRIQYAKAEMKKLVRAYFEEAQWLHRSYIPTFEEYMKVALVSCGYMMLSTASFLGMGDIATKEAFDWVTAEPLSVRASSVINRLMDDMVGHEFEQQRGHVASGVECFMKQYSASKQDAYTEFHKQVNNAWLDINAECLQPTSAPMPLLMRVVNFARVINLLYKDEDWYINSKTTLKDFITSVLVTPATINI